MHSSFFLIQLILFSLILNKDLIIKPKSKNPTANESLTENVQKVNVSFNEPEQKTNSENLNGNTTSNLTEKIEKLNHALDEIVTYKGKVDSLKKLLNDKTNVGFIQDNFQSFIILNKIIGSHRSLIIIISIIGISLILFFSFSTKKSMKYSLTKKRDITITEPEIENEDININNSYNPSIKKYSNDHLNVDINKLYSSIPNSNQFINNTIKTNNHINQSNGQLKSKTEIIDKHAPISAMKDDETFYNDNFEMSFAEKNFYFGNKENIMNETVDFEEREEYTRIINFLGK